MTNIYIKELRIDELNINDIEETIPQNCLEKARKYKQKDDFVRSLIGWYLLYDGLKKDYNFDLGRYEILENEYRKPYINANLYFNISHSNNYVCAIVSYASCGIDIECVRTIKNKDLFIKKIISNNNINNYSDELLIQKWTEKEAYFKQKGTGMSYNYLSKEIENVKTIELIDRMNNKYFLSFCSCDNSITYHYR